jgi:hypothetical protein
MKGAIDGATAGSSISSSSRSATALDVVRGASFVDARSVLTAAATAGTAAAAIAVWSTVSAVIIVLSVIHHALQPRGVALTTLAEMTLLLLPLPRGTAMTAPSQTHSCRKLRFTMAVSLGQLRLIGGVRGPLDSPDTLNAMSRLEATRTPAVGTGISSVASELGAASSS